VITISEETTTYVLVTGPKAGIQVYTKVDSFNVNSDFNPHTKANGAIFDRDDMCSKTHYHGSLFKKVDPGSSACGWGKISDFNDLSKNLMDSSSVVDFNSDAIRDLKLTKDKSVNYSEAKTDTKRSLDALDSLRIFFALQPKEVKINSMINKLIRCTTLRLNKSLDILTDAAEGKIHINDEIRVRRILNSALRCSRLTFKSINKREKKGKITGITEHNNLQQRSN